MTCGCRADCYKFTNGIRTISAIFHVGVPQIIYCPLHANAERMREALRRVDEECPKVTMQPHPMGKHESDYASPAGVMITGETVIAIRQALAASEGKEQP